MDWWDSDITRLILMGVCVSAGMIAGSTSATSKLMPDGPAADRMRLISALSLVCVVVGVLTVAASGTPFMIITGPLLVAASLALLAVAARRGPRSQPPVAVTPGNPLTPQISTATADAIAAAALAAAGPGDIPHTVWELTDAAGGVLRIIRGRGVIVVHSENGSAHVFDAGDVTDAIPALAAMARAASALGRDGGDR